MNVDRLLNMACTVRRHSQTEDNWGTPADTWTADAESTMCWVDLRGRTTESSERPAPADFQIDTVDIFIVADPTVTGRDRIDVAGDGLYEILGPPHTFTHPRTLQQTHTACVGRRIT